MLTDDLKAAIAQNLPQMVGDELKERLERLDESEAEIRRLKSLLGSSQDRNTEWSEKYDRLTRENQTLKALGLRAEELDKKELRLENELLKVQLACAQGQHHQFMDLMKTVFRNPVFKDTQVFHRDFPMPVGPNGQYPVSQHESRSTTQVSEVE